MSWTVYTHGESDCVFIEEGPPKYFEDGTIEIAGHDLTKEAAENLRNEILKRWRLPVESEKQNITKKYRPHRFAEVAGQDVSIRTITSALQSGVIPPAYLFAGIRGCGKTSCARLVAMSLNCEKRIGVEPCGTCDSCKAILSDRSEYLIEVDGATYGKVENVRELMASIRYMVPEGSYKVIIMDECHGLTKQAWDSALKTIEEPPPRTLFIFCTTEFQKVIPAIKSRCVTMFFPGVPNSVIQDVVKNILTLEKVEYEEKSIGLIVKAAGGSIRDAQSILEGFIRTGKVVEEDVAKIYQSIDPNTVMSYFNHIIEKDVRAACNMTSGWVRMGVSPSVVVTGLLEHLRNMILDFIVTDGQLKTMLKHQRERLGDGRIVQWIDFFYDQLEYIRDYPMEYTLVIDLITIKLIESMRVRSDSPTSRKKKGDPEEPRTEGPAVPVIADPPAPAQKTPTKMDMAQITKIQMAMGGIIQSSSPTFTRVTLKDRQGQLFDVVVQAADAISDYYYLYDSIDGAAANPPDSLQQYKRIKSALNLALVDQMTRTVGGVARETPNANCITILDSRGRQFDVVVTGRDAMSEFYFLCSDVEQALRDFPANMNTYLKARF